ncbi:MAG: diguanylate cyclase [Candidatus Atribacteria bacterium]|nr:diguanylate cyclase [Candidatus Atribacteria bacterium]MCD6350384.1 diguanylate cyclase [Candidatus Atribacteria bacterium]
MRSVDAISRWGRGEFLILCPETGLSKACKLAERLCNKIKEHSFFPGKFGLQ